MLDAISINGTDLPPDVVELVTKITEVQETQLDLQVTGKELGTLGQALGGMKRALTRALREAPSDEAVASMVELLNEVNGLDRRIEARVHQLFVDQLGPDYSATPAAQMLNGLIDARAAEAQPPSGNTAVSPADTTSTTYL